jgi:hypothetical protein
MCHCERSEAISRDCPSTSSGHADHGEPVEPFAPRNDYFSGRFTINIESGNIISEGLGGKTSIYII